MSTCLRILCCFRARHTTSFRKEGHPVWEPCFSSELKRGCHSTHSDMSLAPGYSLPFSLDIEFALESVCHLLWARDGSYFLRDPASPSPALLRKCLLEEQPEEALWGHLCRLSPPPASPFQHSPPPDSRPPSKAQVPHLHEALPSPLLWAPMSHRLT